MRKGDRVRFSSKWLRNTGQFTGSICFIRGVVIEAKPVAGDLTTPFSQRQTQILCTVLWDSMSPGYCDDSAWIGTKSKVLAANLEPDPFAINHQDACAGCALCQWEG